MRVQNIQFYNYSGQQSLGLTTRPVKQKSFGKHYNKLAHQAAKTIQNLSGDELEKALLKASNALDQINGRVERCQDIQKEVQAYYDELLGKTVIEEEQEQAQAAANIHVEVPPASSSKPEYPISDFEEASFISANDFL